MSIIIRTLFNNQGWHAPCVNPDNDWRCEACFPRHGGEPSVDVGKPSVNEKGICTTVCWDQLICTDYRWGCTPKGNIFGSRAHVGEHAYFVFKQPNGKYTLWGITTVNSRDNAIMKDGENWERGFSFMHFTPFESLPEDKWVRDLSAQELVGNKWGSGRFRYIKRILIEQLISRSGSH